MACVYYPRLIYLKKEVYRLWEKNLNTIFFKNPVNSLVAKEFFLCDILEDKITHEGLSLKKKKPLNTSYGFNSQTLFLFSFVAGMFRE